MKLKCIRKKANERPILDEVIINKDRLWVMDKNRRYTLFSLPLTSESDSIAYLELDYNIILIALTTDDYVGMDIEQYEYFEIEYNLTISETALYGDVFVLKKAGNSYCELNVEEIDRVMELLNN